MNWMTVGATVAGGLLMLVLVSIKERFFSPGKKVDKEEYDDDMDKMDERITKLEKATDTRFRNCALSCEGKIKEAVRHSEELRKTEMKHIEDLIKSNGKQNRDILEAVRDSIKSIDGRLSKLEEKHLKS